MWANVRPSQLTCAKALAQAAAAMVSNASYLPVNLGGRFSMKAFMPSFWSAVEKSV